MSAQPTFYNLRGELPVIDRVHHPELWLDKPVPRRLKTQIKHSLNVSTLNECFDYQREVWFNSNQMSIFIDRAGCSDPYLKGDLLKEWKEIRLEMPGSWRTAMRRQPPHTKEGDVIHRDGVYFQVCRGGRACRLSLDTLGNPHGAS